MIDISNNTVTRAMSSRDFSEQRLSQHSHAISSVLSGEARTGPYLGEFLTTIRISAVKPNQPRILTGAQEETLRRRYVPETTRSYPFNRRAVTSVLIRRRDINDG